MHLLSDQICNLFYALVFMLLEKLGSSRWHHLLRYGFAQPRAFTTSIWENIEYVADCKKSQKHSMGALSVI